MYLTYDEYKRMGGALSVAVFERHAYRARSVIDRATHDRLRGEEPVRESVRRLMRELVDAEADIAANGGREIVSASNDGVSVSYDAGAAGNAARRYALIRDYLSNETTARGVSLLYAGVVI